MRGKKRYLFYLKVNFTIRIPLGRHVFTISNSIQAVLENFHFSIAETCLKHDKKYISMYFLLRGISD